MAEERIDTLSIGIESDAQKAVNGIERLADKMLSLEKAVAKTESGLSSFVNFFRGFSNSFKDLDNISKVAKPFSQLADIVGKVNKSSISLDTGNVLKSINSIGEKIKNLSGVEDGLSVGLKKQILALERQNNAYDAQKKKIEGLKARIEELSAQKIPTEPYSALIRKIGFLEENLKNTIGIRDDLVARGWTGEKIERYNQQIEKSTAKLREIKQQQEQMLSSGTAFEVNDLDKLTGELEIAEKRLQSMGSELGIGLESLSTNLSNFAAKSEKTKNIIGSFNDILKNIPVAEVRLKDPQKLESQIERLTARWEELKAKLQRDIMTGKITPNFDDSKYRDALVEIEKTEKTIEVTRDKLSQLGTTDTGIEKTRNSMVGAQAVANMFGSAISNLVAQFERLGRKSINIAVNGFKKFGEGVKNAISNLKKLISSVAKFVKENKKSNASMGISFKKILQYAFGIQTLSALLKKMKQAFKDGVQNLVQYSGEVNHSVSLMTSALGALKNALAVAFAPIVNIVAPYLTKFINLLTNAANAVGRFFAALTGKKIATQATKFYKDYAESLNGVAGAAKDADKALHTLGIDELNILNEDKDEGGGGVDIEDMFTDVAIEGAISDWAKKIREAFLNQDWEGLGKTIAEMANAGLQKLYDAIVDITPKVEQALKNFARVFNSFVENLDWDLLGRTIGAGVNLLVKAFNALTGDEGINFELLGRKLSVGFRGLVDEINWRELGNAFGNGFMVAWRILEGFIDDMWRISKETLLTGWAELGIAFAEGVHGVFERVNFGSIGKTLADGFNGIFEIINNFNKRMSDNGTWQEIANNISNGLNNAIKGIHPIEAAQALGKFVTDLLGTMLEVAENTPWFELGTKIGQFLADIPWYTIFTQIFDIITTVLGGLFGGLASELLSHFDEIGTALANGFNYAFEKLREFTAKVPWDSIAVNIYTGLNNMIHGIDWAGAGATLSDFVVKLLGVFQEVAANTDWEAFGRGIGTFLSNIDWKTAIGKVFDILWDVFSGFISGLFDTKAGKVFLAFVAGLTALKGAFDLVDIAIKASKWITLAADTLGGLKDLILTKVVPGVSGAIGTLSNLFSNIVTAAQGAFSGAGILTKIGSVIFSPTGLLIAGVAAGVLLIVANWDKIKEAAKNLWENVLVPFGNFLKDTFTKIWENILAPALSYLSETILPPLMDIFSNLWNEILVPLGNFVASTLGPVFQTFGKILGWLISDVVSPVAKAFTDVLGGALKSVSNIVGDVGEVLQGLIDFISGVFTGDWKKAWEGVKNIFKGIFNLIPDIAEGVINSVIRFINGIINGLNNVTGLVGIPSIPTISEVNLPRFANGGIVMSHMIAEIGEYGRKEAILPLENRKSMSMIADSIMENSRGATFNTVDADAIASLDRAVASQINIIGQQIAGIADVMKKQFVNMFSYFEDVGTRMMQRFLNEMNGTMQVFLNGTMQFLLNGMYGLTEKIMEIVKAVASNIAEIFSNTFSRISGFNVPNIGEFSVPAYAIGGFPENGLSFANSTELASKFNNGMNAAVNNEQIISGIEEAAYRGFVRANAENTREEALLEELIRAVREGKTISIDGRELVQITDSTRQRMGVNFSAPSYSY